MITLTLFLKECKTICKSIIYIAFIGAAILFYTSQIGGFAKADIEQYYTHEEMDGNPLLTNPLIKPQEGAESYGVKRAEIPEQVMLYIIDRLSMEYMKNSYAAYPMGFYKNVKLNEKEQVEIEKILNEISGLPANELGWRWEDAPIGDPYLLKNDDYIDKVTFLAYEEFKEKMKRVDKILGGRSYYDESNFNNYGTVPVTYEDALVEYDAFVNEDKITGAYARLFCDYMGIVIALFSIFIPAAFLMRDKRAKANEIIYSRNISSVKLILIRYTALIVMTLIPILLLSLIPSVQLIFFAVKNELPVDISAFIKYIICWILPTLMTTTAVAFIFTILTDTPVAIAVQFLWSWLSLMIGAPSLGGGHYGMNLIIRHNNLGNFQLYKDGLTQLTVNRVFYTVFAITFIALTIIIYDLKRKGILDVRGNLRKIFRNRKSTD